MFRERLSRFGVVKHSTDRHAVDVSRSHAEADDPACQEIHDGHDPVAIEHDGFASKEIDAPQAVLHVSDEREPRWTIATGRRSEAPSKDTTHHILANFDTERMSNLLGNSRAPESRIAALHLENRGDEFLRGPFGPWTPTGGWCEQQSVFPLDQRPVKAQQRRRFDSNRNLWEAFGRHHEGTDTEEQSIPGRQARGSFARSAKDQQLMLEKE